MKPTVLPTSRKNT